MKILVSAYACEPGKGSEPGQGWNWVREIAALHEAWVITRANNRSSILEALNQSPIPNARWLFFDLPRWARVWKKGKRGARLYYYIWQLAVAQEARRLHERVGFDLGHHVTFGQYARPSCLALLDLPFIFGPVGGGESAPASFRSTFGSRGRAFERARDISRGLGEADPLARLTVRKARLCLASTQETAVRLHLMGCRQAILHACCGLPSEDIRQLANIPTRTAEPFRVLSVGRLEHWKGFHLGFMAFAEFHKRYRQSEYWLVGDGPERSALERLAGKLKVADKVRFWGNLPRPEALAALAQCDTLLHPSLHDSGAWVCIEAMAAGRPVICLDLGGPAQQVTDQTGLKVPAHNPVTAVRNLAAALERLALDPKLRCAMADAGRARVRDSFSWPDKMKVVNGLYEQVVDKGGFTLNGAAESAPKVQL